jgi:Na+-driven multidrug efflux pump
VLLLPLIFDIDGIWYSVVAAELVAAAVTTAFLLALKKKYRY